MQRRPRFGQPFRAAPPLCPGRFFKCASLFDDLEPRVLELLADERDMPEVLGLHVDAKGTADDVAARMRMLVVDADDVRPAPCDDLGNGDELSRFIQKLDVEQIGRASCRERV